MNNEIFEKLEDLESVYPNKRFNINSVIDLFSPIGYGQRCLIVAPPKVGKTTLLKEIASSISKEDVDLNILLVGERPEEVTDFINSIEKCNIYYSTFNQDKESQIEIAEQCIRDSIESVLEGRDVVILLDSLTRLVRSCNLTSNSSKTLSGGIDAAAFDFPKKVFGSAGNYKSSPNGDPSHEMSRKGSGSLTIIATCLIDTGSKMDEVIYEEFKGTGNSEITLSRKVAEMDVFPAIDIVKSGTRNDNLMLSSLEYQISRICKASLSNAKSYDPNNRVIEELKQSSIDGFIETIRENPKVSTLIDDRNKTNIGDIKMAKTTKKVNGSEDLNVKVEVANEEIKEAQETVAEEATTETSEKKRFSIKKLFSKRVAMVAGATCAAVLGVAAVAGAIAKSND